MVALITRGRDTGARELIRHAEANGVTGRWYGSACEILGLAEGAPCHELFLLDLRGTGFHEVVNPGTDAAAVCAALEAAGEAPWFELEDAPWLMAGFACPAGAPGAPAHVHALIVMAGPDFIADALAGRQLAASR